MFKEVLHKAMNDTEGCLGVLIMGMDGIVVDKVWKAQAVDANLDIALAEYTTLMRSATRTNADLGFGKLLEMTVSSENGIFVLHSVGKDYFLAMVMSPDANFGRGRYELRRAELLLQNELVI